MLRSYINVPTLELGPQKQLSLSEQIDREYFQRHPDRAFHLRGRRHGEGSRFSKFIVVPYSDSFLRIRVHRVDADLLQDDDESLMPTVRQVLEPLMSSDGLLNGRAA